MNPRLQNNNQIASNINILVGRSIFHSIVFGQYENGNLHFYGHYFSISFSKLFIAIAIWIWDAIDMAKCLRRRLQIIYLRCNSWIYSIPTHTVSLHILFSKYRHNGLLPILREHLNLLLFGVYLRTKLKQCVPASCRLKTIHVPLTSLLKLLVLLSAVIVLNLFVFVSLLWIFLPVTAFAS